MTISVKELLNAGVHFGHLTSKWNAAMAPYIFMEKNGIHVIDLNKTAHNLEIATKAAKQIVKSGRRILFVATKKQAKGIVSQMAKEATMPYVTERWPGGMLTNFPTIRKTIKKMNQIDSMQKDGTFDTLSKREKLQVTRQRAKLEKLLGSVADMTRIPAAIFVVDVLKEKIAIKEAKKLGIPVFAMVDTNSDPGDVNFVIPANDDATDSIKLIVSTMTQAIKQGMEERQAEREANKQVAEKEAKANKEGELPQKKKTSDKKKEQA